MTVVAFSNVAGQARGEPLRLPARRRRLSTIVARHRPVGRRFLVSVHRDAIGEASLVPSDATVRLRARWSGTLVGPRDVVVITILPLGGGSGGSGGGKSALGIGMAIASIALIAVAPYAAPALAGAAVFGAGVGATTGTLATAIQVGMVVGGVALGAAAQLASGAGAKAKNRTLYSVTGGGNVPRPNARKPLLYGRCWSTPPLSQRDFFRYEGDTMVLTKRMTLGLGRFKIHAIKAGEATFWTEESALVPPFNVAGNAVEFLYETPSQLAVGDAVSSGDVAGQELPRPGGNPAVTPWFRLAPQGVSVDQALLSWSYQSVSRTSSAGRQAAGYAGVVFMARRIDPASGAPMGAPFELLRDAIGPVLSPATALRYSRTVRLPARGAYEVYGQNLYPAADFAENKASWDELVGIVDDVRVRPATTEVVIQVRAGPGLNFAAFGDLSVLATRILPVWDGATWVEQPTRKAVWAAADLVRNEYGLDQPDGFDLAKALHYIGELQADDTFDGALPEVSSYWEAAGTVLFPMRADPVKVGVVHSFVRDESRDEPRHVLTRRQIVRDSGGASFQLLGEGGDVIVEFDRDGDPKRPDEARYSFGTPSRTPRRYKVPGIVDGDHALRLAKWLALVSVFRGASRTVVTEWDGRLVYPGDHVLSDLWFLKGPAVYGVAGAVGRILTLDCDAALSTDWGYGSIRTRLGREWGILRMRGLGGRRVELHAEDVATLETRVVQTVEGPVRFALADVLARDTQDPTTIVVGELEELQETYVVRAAIPTDADHVRIEMLHDDRRIWELLGEEVHGPLPVDPDGLAEPLLPNIRTLRARCERIETGIEVVWSIAPPRGARSYDVWLSYDGDVTRERLSSGTAIEGRAPIRQSESVVTLIAVAYGSTGLAGREAETTFTTVAPIVRGDVVDITTLALIPYEKLGPDAREKIDAGRVAADEAKQAADEAEAEAIRLSDNIRRGLAADPSVRQGFVDGMMGDVQKSVSFLAEVATRLLNEVNLLKSQQVAAGIEVLPDQGIVRIAGLARLETEVGTRLTSLSVTVDALQGLIESYGAVQTGDLSGLVTQINTVRQTLNATNATIATLATSAQFDQVSATLGSVQTTLDAQGAEIEQRATKAVVTEQGSRLTTVESGLNAAEGRIRSAVTAAGTGQVDVPMLTRILSQLGDVLMGQIGTLSQNVARAETNASAAFDDQGRAVAEVSTRLFTFQGDASAQFATVTRAIAGANEALVQSQTLLLARIGEASAEIAEERTARTAADTAQTIRLDSALVRIGSAEAGITSLGKTVADNQNATASQFQGVSARLGQTETGIQSLAEAASSDREANGRFFTAVDVRFGKNEGSISNLSQAVVTESEVNGRFRTAVDTRFGQNETRISTLSEAIVNESEANGQFRTAVDARFGRNEGSIDEERRVRTDATNALGTAIDTLIASTPSGTAAGRIRFEAVSGPAGVTARYSIQLSTVRNGVYRNSGLFLDILADGTSRIVMDANVFALTGDGGITYPFTVQDGITTIRDLRVTQTAILPGTVTVPYSLPVGDFDPGGSSDQWREIPGTALALAADIGVWSIMFSGTADVSITVVGTAGTTFSASLEVAIGVDGAVYAAGAFATTSRAAGGGLPPSVTERTGLKYSPASLEFVTAGQPRRFALLYRFRADPGSSGRINYAQFKALVTKR